MMTSLATGDGIGQMDDYIAEQLVRNDDDREKTALALDGRIRGHARHFVQFGLDLMAMRDGQFYRDLPGHNYADFGEYMKTVNELTQRRARQLINASLVYQCIEKVEPGFPLPTTEKQVRALIESDVVSFEQKKVQATTASGQPREVKQTVGVKNPTRVAKSWEKAYKAYEKHAEQYREEHGKEPRPMSYMFIRKQFPGGEQLERSKDTTRYATAGRAIAKFRDSLRGIRDKYKGDLASLMEEEEWTDQHRESLGEMIHGAIMEAEVWLDQMQIEICEPLYCVTCGRMVVNHLHVEVAEFREWNDTHCRACFDAGKVLDPITGKPQKWW